MLAAGLADGRAHVLRRRGAAAALGATGSYRFLYGILLLMSILLYRNYFYPQPGNTALRHYSLLVDPPPSATAAAALVTPAGRPGGWPSRPGSRAAGRSAVS